MPVWNFEPVEQDFAEAALDPSLWVKALDTVTAATASYGTVLIPSHNVAIPNFPSTESLAGSTDSYFRDGWHLRDERNRGIPKMMQRGVVDDFDIFDLGTITKNPYYQEFLAPHRLRWFAGIRISSGNDLWCLSIQRTLDQDPFSEAEKDQLARLSSRLSSSAALGRALGASAATGILEAFEISGNAVVLIDRRGEVFSVNQSAERLLIGDVRIERRRIVGRDAQATTALNHAIHNLLARPTGGLSTPIVLPRTGQRPLVAYGARLTGLTANALADCQAMIVFINLDAGPRPPEASLRTIFQLSEAEAKLAAGLARGESLDLVAERLGIAKETSRSQLKSIFAKTGVRRQAELVALLASVVI